MSTTLPTGTPPRLHGLDLARGLAVLGMFAAHTAAPPDLVLDEPSTWAGVVDGRSSVLFATLLGVSLALVTGRTHPPEGAELALARRRVLVRAGCLLVLGGLVQLLVTDVAVVLEFLALLTAVSVLVLGWRPRRLFLLAGVLALVAPPVTTLLVAVQRTGLLGSGGVLGQLAVSGTYPALVWSAFVVAGVGVGRLDLTRARVRGVLALAGAGLAVLGYGGSWLLGPQGADASEGSSTTYTGNYADPSTGAYESTLTLDGSAAPGWVPGGDVALDGMQCTGDATWGWTCVPDDPDPTDSTTSTWIGDDGASGPRLGDVLDPAQFTTSAPHSGSTFEVLGSGGVALLVLAACLALLAALGDARRWVLAPLTALGSMPLSAYCGHLVALAVVGAVTDPAVAGGSWTEWAWLAGVALAACTLWRWLLGRGPLERAVARVVDHLVPRGR